MAVLVDVHRHVVPPEMAADPAGFGARDSHFARLAESKGAALRDGKSLLADMAAEGVDRAVVFGFGFRDVGVSRLQNDYAASLARDHPDRLIAFAVLDPESPGAVAEAERCLSLGVRGFGELFPAGHGFSLQGPGMGRLASLAVEAGVPLFIHVNEQVGHDYPGKGEAGAREAYVFATRNPRALTVFAHFGGGLPLFAAMPEVGGLENAYYDTAAQPFLYGPQVYRAFKTLGVLDRILLGSDYPLLSCARYLRDLARSGLPDEDIRSVASANALAFLGRFFPG